jgi:hypothetical protein
LISARSAFDLLLLGVREGVIVAHEGPQQANDDQRDDEQRHEVHEQDAGDPPHDRHRNVVAVAHGRRRHDRPPECIAQSLVLRAQEAEPIQDSQFPERIGRVDDAADQPLWKRVHQDLPREHLLIHQP